MTDIITPEMVERAANAILARKKGAWDAMDLARAALAVALPDIVEACAKVADGMQSGEPAEFVGACIRKLKG